MYLNFQGGKVTNVAHEYGSPGKCVCFIFYKVFFFLFCFLNEEITSVPYQAVFVHCGRRNCSSV